MTGEDLREPGYCIVCGDFHLITPIPGHPGGGVCGAPSCQERLQPPEPGARHVCNTGDRLKPGHAEYRQCSCGQWYHSGGGYWYKVPHPPARWLRSHGVDAGEFWGYGDEDEEDSSLGAFFTSISRWRYLLRYLWRS
jgi:hypothetical protein